MNLVSSMEVRLGTIEDPQNPEASRKRPEAYGYYTRVQKLILFNVFGDRFPGPYDT